ncbi:DUF2225 domain-containing protein [Treponema sp.]
MSKVHEERELKTTFLSKDAIHCPACDTSFHKEELLSGGGRLIAGPLTDELHRVYEPSIKYGDIYPLVFHTVVCPSCWFASSENDFSLLPQNKIEQVNDERDARIADVQAIFNSADFTGSRGLAEGAAAHYLALRCYELYPKEFSPTLKMGIEALRAAWLLDDLHANNPGEHYDWAAILFKRKARFLYKEALLREQSGKEALSGLRNFGPDSDKNYGYEGALYLSALLELKYGSKKDEGKRRAALGEAKRTIAKIFGLGKSSKNKPGPLLEKARDLYDNINIELNESDE